GRPDPLVSRSMPPNLGGRVSPGSQAAGRRESAERRSGTLSPGRPALKALRGACRALGAPRTPSSNRAPVHSGAVRASGRTLVARESRPVRLAGYRGGKGALYELLR